MGRSYYPVSRMGLSLANNEGDMRKKEGRRADWAGQRYKSGSIRGILKMLCYPSLLMDTAFFMVTKSESTGGQRQSVKRTIQSPGFAG